MSWLGSNENSDIVLNNLAVSGLSWTKNPYGARGRKQIQKVFIEFLSPLASLKGKTATLRRTFGFSEILVRSCESGGYVNLAGIAHAPIRVAMSRMDTSLSTLAPLPDSHPQIGRSGFGCFFKRETGLAGLYKTGLWDVKVKKGFGLPWLTESCYVV
jgi:hypothetical protein